MHAPRFAIAVLGFTALIYTLLGAWFLLDPQAVEVTGVLATTPAQRTELRATYGGMELGLGLFLLWTAFGDTSRRRTGLLAALLVTAGFGVGRAVGIALDRPPESIFLTLLLVEAVTVALTGLALWALPATEPAAPESP